jgi:hypothetical protein
MRIRRFAQRQVVRSSIEDAPTVLKTSQGNIPRPYMAADATVSGMCLTLKAENKGIAPTTRK